MKFSCYQESSVIHGYFVYCFFLEIRHLSKSEIRFRMASFSVSPFLMHKRVAKSEAILALLDTFQCCISNGKPVFDVCFFISDLMKSCVVYAAI